MTVLEIVKSKLGDNPPDDASLKVDIEEVGQAIKNHCNRTDIPNELRFVHANMVIDFIKGVERGNDPEGNTAVASIKEGDATVQFGSARLDSRERSTERILYDYAKQLNRFRKLRW